MQSRFVKNGVVSKIRCGANGSEMEVDGFFLDGFVTFEGRRIGLDF